MADRAPLRIVGVAVLCLLVHAAGEDCKKTINGLEYQGKISVTKSGHTCQRWDSQSPHKHTGYAEHLPGGATANENYCRNPKDWWETGPWCYTTDPRKRWDYCDIPFCGSLVNQVTPNHGSKCGETRILITGVGFSKDNINEGNKVRLVSSSMSYDCAVNKDGTTEEDILCYSPPGMKEDKYYVRLNVDGEDVPIVNHCRNPTDFRCRFEVRYHNTPTITSVEPSSGPPQSIIQIRGRIVTDLFDTNVEKGTNGKTEKIARVYAGPQLCSLKAENDVFYGIKMDSESSWNGYMKCKMNGKFVGNQNVSYIVTGSFGRACRPHSLPLSRTKQLYLFQSYAEITSISPARGSVHGGTSIIITGRNFDQTRAPAKVMISGQTCEVKSVTDTRIVCRTPPKPESSYSSLPGNRGLLLEIWNKTGRSREKLYEVLDFHENMTDYIKSHTDRLKYYDNVYNDFVTRHSGFFVPPWTGDYSFVIKADDVGALYFSNTTNPNDTKLIAECPSYANNYYRFPQQFSQKFRLTAGEAYPLVALHRDYRGPAKLDIVARFYQTELTNQSTGFAQQEHQKIEVRSAIVREVQTISLVTENVRPGVYEVQKVEICDPANGGAPLMFRLGFYSVYTDILTSQSSETAIKNALKSLPLFHSHESVNIVNKTLNSGCLTIFVEFVSNRGNFEDLKVMMKQVGQAMNITVQEVTTGEATGEYFALEMAGVISPLFSGKPNQLQMEGDLGKIFESRCPRALGDPVSKTIHYSFESGGLPSPMSRGTVTSEVEAFCGKKSVMNPSYLYYDKNSRISLGQNVKVICFAYHGKLQNFLKLGFSYKNNKGETLDNQYAYPSITFQQSAGWNYKCVDMLAAVQKGLIGSTFKIFQVEIRKDASQEAYYVDEVYVGKNPTVVDEAGASYMRLRPVMPAGQLVESVSVNRTDDNNTAVYQVTFTPQACAYNFPLLAVVPGQISNGTALNVVRVSSASPPVTGNFSVTFRNKTTEGIPFTVNGATLGSLLQAGIPEMGNLYTYKHGGCATFDLHVGFHSNPGDQETLQITNYGQGVNVTVEVKTVNDGNVWMDPIPGDMLATPHSSHQVMAYINDIPTHCAGTCAWEWSQSATPTVISVSPASGFPTSTEITITGTGFHDNHTLNSVMIGGVACATNSSNSTQIVCRVGDGPTGTFPVVVNVAQLGIAENINNSVTFTYQFSIQSMTPSAVSLGGGLNLTLEGYGFSAKDKVYIGSLPCPILTSSSTQTVCLIPPSMESKTASVIVKQGNTGTNVTHSASLQYSNASMIFISSIEPNSTSVAGGTEITIQGSDLNTTQAVMIGDQQVSFTRSLDTEIKVVLPPRPAGAYSVKLLGPSGLAVDSSNMIPAVEWRLIVTDISPLQGSLRGGTTLTILGDGFSLNKTRNSVMVGEHPCELESVKVTELTCKIKDTAKVHVVDNSGIHPTIKLSGYAWNPQYLIIKVGDIVEWRWKFASYISGMRPRVVQVKDEMSVEEMEGGFNSGPGKESGVFRHQFTSTGRYCYWSDYIDQYKTTWFRGCVTVVDLSSYVADIRVKVNGYEAVYQKLTPQSPKAGNASLGGCSGDSKPVSNCSVPEPSGGDPTKFNFKFWTCTTPVVTGLSENNGTVNTNITVQGTGLSNNDCQNEITFGDGKCKGDQDNGPDVVCNIDSSNSPAVGLLQPITIRHNNLGYALVAITSVKARSFALMPAVTKVMPSNGSEAGGSIVQLQGSGFPTDKDYVSVTIGGYSCDLMNLTYTEVVCRTKAGQGQKDVEVRVKSQGQWVPAVCEGVCKFTYDAAYTPKMTSVSPAMLNGTEDTRLEIEGSGFGNVTADISVKIGGEVCEVTAISNSSVQCTVGNLPAGPNAVIMEVAGKGLASGTIKVTGKAIVTDISPAEGSIHGGTRISISGNGFVEKLTAITIKGNPCQIVSVNLSTVSCITPSYGKEERVDLKIMSNTVTYPTETFNYTNQASPNVSSIHPTNGSAGTEITITGTGFDSQKEKISVNIGTAECSVVSSSESEIKCTAGASLVGSFPVVANVEGKGRSDQRSEFEYQLLVTSISPKTGGTAGDQLVTVSGSGFDNTTSVWICDRPCKRDLTANQSASEFGCRTPVAADGNLTCSVKLTSNNVTRILTDAYTYNPAITANITMVTPARGGTAGGTRLTIKGTGFGSVKGDVSVTIAGTVCDVQSVSPTQITCVTNQHKGSQKTDIRVEVAGNGKAVQTSAEFFYIDVWSSPFTWGGGPLPKEGDLVVITPGQTILLDVSPPRLTLLLIQGGALIFDEKDLELKAVNILIVQNGLLQIGTEEKPFQHKAIITLYGNHRTKEYPIYGTKSLAVRQGNLELHGKPVPVTWTTLDATVYAGNSTIVLREAVTWKAGDKVVIATTSHRHSQKETELRIIQSVASDNRTITLTEPLKYEHLGVSETFDGTEVDFRAEVGMVSRNIVVRGDSNQEWVEKIEACPDGFDTGEFATQTCFQGRFGEEMGSDQFGAQIMIHSHKQTGSMSHARLEYVEVTHAGQAFRLGRYPIHFHLNGDTNGSYVRGCGIYNTFNRAINIHGSRNILVEHNVAYNVMGGAFFFEDGIETGSIVQYNLLMFVRESSSLQNDDVTPAAYWVTNPDNTIQHNRAVGGTHFGFWYRMHKHPDGPSFDNSICPQHIPVRVFRNNTAHSNGWFGLWIFTTIKTRQGGQCGSNTPAMSLFESLTAWNNEKGAEIVNGGALECRDFVLVNNKLAGYEGKLLIEGDQLFKDHLIVGHAQSLTREEQGCTRAGFILPYGNGLTLDGIRFVNFDESSCVGIDFARIDGTCGVHCGGFYYETKNLKWVSSPNKGTYPWPWAGVLKDLDGTLIGETGNSASITANAGKSVISASDTLPSTCVSFPKFSNKSGSIPAKACPPQLKFHRFSFNGISPSALNYKDFLFSNRYGNDSAPWRKKAITHKMGWMTVFIDGEEYFYTFKDAEQLTNISYVGRFDRFQKNNSRGGYEYVILRQKVSVRPDRFFLDGSTNIEPTRDIDGNTNNGQWEYLKDSNEIKYIISSKTSSRRRRSVADYRDYNVNFKAYKCYWLDCKAPIDPNTVPPVTKRPYDFQKWSESSTWKNASGVPKDGDDVTIGKDQWVVADTTIPKMGKLVLYGVLELDDANGTRNFEINCTYIIIMGGRLIIGWPDQPFLGRALILLEGQHSTPPYPTKAGPPVGSKAIGVFGGLDLHGKDVGTSWTLLEQTANPGDNQITLVTAVTWKVGDEIAIAPTDFTVWEKETFAITAVSNNGKTLTLNSTLKFKHIAHTETAGDKSMTMAAEVGLLTRNIRVEGASYDKLYKQSFGARILVSQTQDPADSKRLLKGYARISNVEFYHSGQEGWVEPVDARGSIAYIDAGTVSDIKPSYVKKCAFHKGFSPAIMAYATNKLPIEDNVITDTVWYAVESMGDGTIIRNNFVSKVLWEGGYMGRRETENFRYNGAFNLDKATNIILENNHVGGAERLGFRTTGEPCSVSSINPWTGNVVHSALIGVALLPNNPLPAYLKQCTMYSNFTLWKNLDYGIFYLGSASSSVENLQAADNGVAVFQLIMGPPSLSHRYQDKYAKVKNSFIIGTSDELNCATAKGDKSDFNIQISRGKVQSHSFPRRVGVTMPTFTSGSNACPEMGCNNIMSYQTIKGIFHLQDTTFSKFSNKCNNGGDRVVAPNRMNDDGNHPFITQRTKFYNTSSDNKVLYWRSDIGKIDSSNCVDMACDAKVKCLLQDLDGTFLGSPGFIIPQSEHEWNGNPKMGLGDYRIPKEMLTRLNGSRIPVNEIAPHKGIIRSSCQYKSAWQAYECHDLNYKSLVIESMDADTETRRLSPVAILGDGYLDLINGPQDHGWCSGYTCRKRLSTFQAIVATGKDFLLHYTSVSPQKSRFFLLDAKPDDCVTLSVWYSQPYRLDVYHDGKFILPPNARFEGADKRYIIDPPPLGQPDYYKPNATGCTLKSGTSFFNRDTGIITLMIKGPAPVEIVTVKAVMVSFQLPAMPENEFYGDKIIMNLASFLNIDASRVRITKIVRETSSVSGRRKRATNKITGVEIEISNPPSSEVNTTASKEDLSSNQLQNITTTIVNDVQLGSSSLKTLINSTGVAISEPPPDPADPNWQTVTQENKESSFEQLVQPSQMRQQSAIGPLHEGAPFSTQPRFQIYDVNGNVVQKLGTLSNPWIITATLKAGTGHSAARLIGSSTAKYHNGWANFTDLGISHYGDDYVVDFAVTSPAAAGYSLSSAKFSLKKRPLKVNVRNITADIMEDSVVTMEIELQDQVTSQVVKEINWRNHSWAVNVSLDGLEYYSGQMLGDRATVFNENTSVAILSNLRFNAQGMVILKIRVTSDPAEYALETDTLINIRKKNLVLSSNFNSSQRIELLFEADYDAIVGSRYTLQFQAMMGNYLTQLYPNIILNTVTISKGSIVVTFQVSGNSGQMNSTVDSLCSAVKNRTEFNFRGTKLSLSNYLMVDGVNYHYSQCNAPVIVVTKEKEPLPLEIVIAAGVVCLVLLLIIVAAIVWRVKVAPKTKTHTITSPDQIRKTENLSVYRKKDPDNPVNSFVNETYDSVAPADTSFTTFRTSGGSTVSKKDLTE